MLMGARPPAQGAIEAGECLAGCQRPGSVSDTVSSARAELTSALQDLADGASDPEPSTCFSVQWAPSRPSSR